jgi:hypothetical protein
VNLTEMTEEVLGHQFAESRYTTFVHQQLNRCQTLLAQKINFRELYDVEDYATTSGDGEYALPSDYMRLDSLFDADNDDSLAQLTTNVYDDLASDSSGRPTNYVIDRTNIKLYPVPDGAYNLQLRHYRYPATMTGSASPEIPAAGHHILVRYALARCFERENDMEQAQYHWGMYQSEELRFMGSIGDEANDIGQPRQVPGMWQPTEGVTVVRP